MSIRLNNLVTDLVARILNLSRLVVLFLSVFLVIAICFSSFVGAQQNGSSATISTAQDKLVSCYNAAKSAEEAGANISGLTNMLNAAGALLSKAEYAYSDGDFGSAQNLAIESQGVLKNFVSDANALRAAATNDRNVNFWINIVGSVAGTVAVIAGSFVVWTMLKRKYGNRELKKLNLQQFKALFIVVIAVLALLVASPALQRVLVLPQTEFFTELSLLGPSHVAANYPRNITANENYSVFLGIANNLGSCAYYQVELEFRNETQSAPDGFNQTPSALPSLFNVPVFVANKESWELPVTFSLDYSFSGETRVLFNGINFNGLNLNLAGLSSDWNSKTNVFYGNLIFELWIYNGTTGSFQYNYRFVDLNFNMTATGV